MGGPQMPAGQNAVASAPLGVGWRVFPESLPVATHFCLRPPPGGEPVAMSSPLSVAAQGPGQGIRGRLWGWHHFSGKCEGAAPAPLRAAGEGGTGGQRHRATSHPRARARVRVPGCSLEASPLALTLPPHLSWGLEGRVSRTDMLACCPRMCGTRWAMCPWSGMMTSPMWATTWMAGASISPCAPGMSWTSSWTEWTTPNTGEPGGATGGGRGARGGQRRVCSSDGRPPGAQCRTG